MQLSLLQLELSINETFESRVDDVTILLAVITVATDSQGLGWIKWASGSQYCLQLSLLQPLMASILISIKIVTILLAVITVATHVEKKK